MSKQRTDVALRATMDALVELFPGCAVFLLVAPPKGPFRQRVNYISNVPHADIIAMMKETVARFEGRAHEAPAGRQ